MVLLKVLMFPVCIVKVSDIIVLSMMFSSPTELTLHTKLPRVVVGIFVAEIDEAEFVNSMVLVEGLMFFVPSN